MSIDGFRWNKTEPHPGRQELHLTLWELVEGLPSKVFQCLDRHPTDHRPCLFPGGTDMLFYFSVAESQTTPKHRAFKQQSFYYP